MVVGGVDTASVLQLDDDKWDFMAELEGLGFVLGKFVIIVQTEKQCTGGYRPIIYLGIADALDQEGCGIPALVRPVKALNRKRREFIKYVDLSLDGQDMFDRAKAEFKRRMRKSDITVDEVISLLGDIRLAQDSAQTLRSAVKHELLKSDTDGVSPMMATRQRVLDAFTRHLQAHKSFKATLAPPAVGAAPSAAAAAAAAAEAGDFFMGAPQQPAAGVAAAAAAAAAAAKAPEAVLKVHLAKVLTDSKAMQWQEWLPQHGGCEIKGPDGTPKAEDEITAMDLLCADIGPYYCELVANAPEHQKESIAKFVSFIMEHLADNMAESINERHIHIGNQIMTCDRTSMSPELLERLAVLRMNCDWMQARKRAFGRLLQYLDLGALKGVTVVD